MKLLRLLFGIASFMLWVCAIAHCTPSNLQLQFQTIQWGMYVIKILLILKQVIHQLLEYLKAIKTGWDQQKSCKFTKVSTEQLSKLFAIFNPILLSWTDILKLPRTSLYTNWARKEPFHDLAMGFTCCGIEITYTSMLRLDQLRLGTSISSQES